MPEFPVICDIVMNTKKIISLVVSLGLLSSVTVAVANAADSSSNVDIAVESVTAAAGEQVAISVNANIPEPGIAGCEFSFSYDPEVITIDSIKEGNISGGTGAAAAELDMQAELADTMISGSEYSCLDYSINSTKGEVSVMWCTGLEDQSYWLKGEGNLITIMATVKDGATGSTEIGINAIGRDGNEGITFGYVDYETKSEVTYAVNAEKGIITIGGEATETTTEEPVITETSETVTEATTSEEAPSTTNGSLGTPSLLGDANDDGEVDIRDVTILNQYVVKTSVLTEQGMANADVIVDGIVDIKDLGQIKKYIIKVIKEF